MTDNIFEKGHIEIKSENMFPIIKKWLYSDRDIFIRELVSNGCDAITKMQKLVSMGEAESNDEDYKINVTCNADDSTLVFEDNGLGMTAEEVKKYINTVAFSSADEFLNKFQDEGDFNSIIGHFGLGFYSAFMVADRVTIDTKSYVEDAEAVLWSCDGDIQYEMEASDKADRGTKITLHLMEDSIEFSKESEVRAVLDKYCSFLPYSIYLGDEEDSINDTQPLWQKAAQDCTDEEYKEFYHKVFGDVNDPLFWIHLNVDYPFRLKGILFFPKLSHQFDSMEGSIKLYNNQVYVADNIKEVIPEYLMMLKGVIDCPDLPLNVSRSFLQNDREVQRIPSYITRKVGDKLVGLAKNDAENYEQYWKDIHPFVKYGCMRDKKLFDKVADYLLFECVDDTYKPWSEVKPVEEGEEHSHPKIYYVNDRHGQAPYIDMYNDNDLSAVILDTPLDPHFITFMEMEQHVRFVRIDSELPDELKGDKEIDITDLEALTTAFRRAAGRENMAVTSQALKTGSTAAMVRIDEFMRRTTEMQSSMLGDMGKEFAMNSMELVLNPLSPVIERLAAMEKAGTNEPEVDDICMQIFDLARLTAGLMEPSDMSAFIKRSGSLLSDWLQDDE